jgi:cytochrome P450
MLGWMSEHFIRFGDTYRASLYGESAYVTRDPAFADHVLRQGWRNYTKGRAIKRISLLLGNGLMVSEGELWKRQRRMIQPAFRRETVAALLEAMRATNYALVRSWTELARRHETLNLTRDVSCMVLQLILIAIFGDDYDSVAPHFDVLTSHTTRDLQFAQAFGPLGKIVSEVVARRRKRAVSHPDILGALIDARSRDSGEAMSESQLISEIKTLVVAGHETTASTINWIWYLLARNRSVEQRLSQELRDLEAPVHWTMEELARFAYARRVIEEALRLYPAGWLLTRRALKDDQFGGYAVPRGTEIYLPIYFIQRHPDLWEHPDRFDPDRFGGEQTEDHRGLAMLPFSAGPRNCIGEFLARTEMQVHLIAAAKRLRLRCTTDEVPQIDLGVNLRTKHDLIMTAEITAPV